MCMICEGEAGPAVCMWVVLCLSCTCTYPIACTAIIEKLTILFVPIHTGPVLVCTVYT